MSTKALREALRLLDARTSPSRGAWENGDDAARETLAAAMAEVEAIERMARRFEAAGDIEQLRHQGRSESADLLETIARAAP